MDLRSKAVLVTGGSKGLGAALARKAAARGGRVVVAARHEAELDDVVAAIRSWGGEAHAVVADIGDKSSIYPLAGTAAALVGPIDVLIHNASALGPTPLKLLLDTDCEDFQRVLDVNVVGPFRLSKVVAGSMALRGSGVIVHVSSDASVNAYPTWGAYSVSKASLDHLARLWAAELGEFGVRVFAVDPGEMDTAMHRDAMSDANPAELAQPDDVAERVIRMIETAHDVPSGARLEASKWKETS
jgi:NAD(P)-dependent dehydrogenase (short-subunit alcohol dehydrogenase family)